MISIAKVNERWYIRHYLCLANLSKSFSQLIVSIFIFSQHCFLIDFGRWKSVWLTRPTYYRDSSTLRDIFYSFVLIAWKVFFEKITVSTINLNAFNIFRSFLIHKNIEVALENCSGRFMP